MPRLSIILPTYNEAATICSVLREICAVLDREGSSYELLVLDDASPDHTADCVEQAFGDRKEVVLVRRSPPHGLAVAIRDGIARARAEVLVVMDADFNHDPADVPRLVSHLAAVDLVGGSRFLPGGGMYSRTRQLGSYAMNVIIRMIVRTGMKDNLSGFFTLRRTVLDGLPFAQIFFGYGDFYFRLLWHARRRGAQLLEIPVVYRPREGGESKTPLLRTSIRYTMAAVRFAITR